MAAIDHLHQETNVLQITNHTELLAAQYLAKCLMMITPVTTSRDVHHHQER